MKSLLLTLGMGLLSLTSTAQNLYFPPLSGNAWEATAPEDLGWCPDKIDSLLHYLDGQNTKAFLVLKDGKIVIEHYFGTFTQDSLWYWASAGKSLTAFLVGLAQEQNYLSISDTSSKYLGQGWTNCTPEQEAKITIRHQLTMTTGLDDGVPDNHCYLDTCLQYLADPGTRWAYHNAPYTLLDGVLASATGMNANAFFNAKLRPLTGITGLFIPLDYDNVFFSKARSMARYGLLVLNHGNWNGTQVMTDTDYFNQMVNTSQNLNPSYGYLWWLNGKPSFMVPGIQLVIPGSLHPHAPNDMFSALGKNGQIINIIPSQNLITVRMGNAPDAGEVPVIFNDIMWQKLEAAMCTSAAEAQAQIPSQFSISPNPAQITCTVSGPTSTPYRLQMLNPAGAVIFEKNNCSGTESIPLSNVPKGIYFLRLQTNKGHVESQKIIIY